MSLSFKITLTPPYVHRISWLQGLHGIGLIKLLFLVAKPSIVDEEVYYYSEEESNNTDEDNGANDGVFYHYGSAEFMAW